MVPRVVITMPAYRAERTLAKTVADIPVGVADRLILVDDASADNTARLARDLGIEVHVHPENLGYGGNQKTCYMEALRSGADVVVLLHPDYQYEPKAIPLLIAPILAGDADMTFGSRFAGLGDPMGGGMPIYRYVGNRLTTIAENIMLGSRFTELHSGLRAYTRRCLLSLPFLRYSDDFVFDSQLLVDAVTSGQRVVEVPIPTRYTKESSSVAIGRSLTYIARSLEYCARVVAQRGRRGRRSPVTAVDRLALDSRDPVDGCPACQGRMAPVTHESERLGSRQGNDQHLLRCTHCGLIAGAGRLDRGGPADASGGLTQAASAALLDALGGYFVPGNRLLALGNSERTFIELALQRGWSAFGPSDGDSKSARSRGPTLRTAARDEDGVVHAIALLEVSSALANSGEELRHARDLLDPEGLVVARAQEMKHDVPRASIYGLTADSVRAYLSRFGLVMVECISGAQQRPALPRAATNRPEARSFVAIARRAESAVPRRAARRVARL